MNMENINQNKIVTNTLIPYYNDDSSPLIHGNTFEILKNKLLTVLLLTLLIFYHLEDLRIQVENT